MHHSITPVVARERSHELSRRVRAAQHGSAPAWDALVRDFTPTLRRIAWRLGLQPTDIDDVVQTTWLEAFHDLDELTQPSAFAGWISTCTRRHAWKRRRAGAREVLVDERRDEPAHDPEVWEQVVRAQDAEALADAVSRLPEPQRKLMQAVLDRPGSRYRELADALGIPIGSIGPTRKRSLERLRGDGVLVAKLSA